MKNNMGIRRLVREEAGVVLPLAVIMVVLVGVMGAGLLTFVNRDLETVVRVNQGQRAFDLADAGVQVAKRQILVDDAPAHYDVDGAARSDFYDATCNIPSTDPQEGSPIEWSVEGGGATRSFAGGELNVTIRWMSGDPTSATCKNKAPVPVALDSPVRYFQVISTGCVPDCTNPTAKRRVEAIYNTHDAGVPKAYFSPTGVTIGGSSCIKGVSVFSLRNISIGSGGSGCPTGGNLQGVDGYYGNWKNSFNSTPRVGSLAGLGTPEDVDHPIFGRDYDKDTTPKFVKDPTSNPQSLGEIAFPFDYKTQLQNKTQADRDRLDFYEAIARANNTYYEVSGNNPSLNSWPNGSNYDTVVYIRLTDNSPGTLSWNVDGDPGVPDAPSPPYPNGCEQPTKKGVLIVENGNFTTQPNKALFSGAVLIRGNGKEDGNYADTGGTCFEGFVNASGEIKINGNANPNGPPSALFNSPGLYGVQLWSWRELYQ